MKNETVPGRTIGRDPAAGTPACLRDFAGRWQLRRTILDARTGTGCRMVGEAWLRPVQQGLAYEESGLLCCGSGPPLRATRRYGWHEDGPGRIGVTFEDGRFFHAFTLAGRAAATHDCAPDRYEVLYDFAAWPHWHAVWRVQGPRKDYTSTTDYAPPA